MPSIGSRRGKRQILLILGSRNSQAKGLPLVKPLERPTDKVTEGASP